tara:strand:- start:216 stop:614 length:399 start_codon:yes stop_codon:yes gene_type:complete
MTTFENDIRLAYISTLLDGGYTLLQEGTENPTIGYIVGGAKIQEGHTMNVPTLDFNDSREIDSFKDFMNLWISTGAMCDADMDEGIGTWIHEGKIYFDVVQHFFNEDLAIDAGKKRGQVAIWDCKNQKEITL